MTLIYYCSEPYQVLCAYYANNIVFLYMFFLKNRRTKIIFIPIDLFSLKSFSCVECESKTLIPFLRVRSIMLRLQNDKYPLWLWSYFIYKSILLFWKAITCLVLEIWEKAHFIHKYRHVMNKVFRNLLYVQY